MNKQILDVMIPLTSNEKEWIAIFVYCGNHTFVGSHKIMDQKLIFFSSDFVMSVSDFLSVCRQSLCLSVSLYVCFSVCLFLCLSIFLSLYKVYRARLSVFFIWLKSKIKFLFFSADFVEKTEYYEHAREQHSQMVTNEWLR